MVLVIYARIKRSCALLAIPNVPGDTILRGDPPRLLLYLLAQLVPGIMAGTGRLAVVPDQLGCFTQEHSYPRSIATHRLY